MSAHTLSGHCLCGAARFTAEVERREMDACHCSMCRRWGGGPATTVFATALTFEDETPVGLFVSSDWAERGFCKACGTGLFWRTRDGKMLTVNAQAFDPPLDYPLTVEIYIDHKPENYAFANDTTKMTQAQVEAMIAGGGEANG